MSKGLLHGIYRIDDTNNSTHAWVVTLRRHSGDLTEYFSDGKHGSAGQALDAALRRRDELHTLYPVRDQVARMTQLRRNNRTGVSGVYRWPADGSAVKGCFWGAQWPGPDGKARHKKFLISVHGEEGAKAKALAERRRALRSLQPAPIKKAPQ